MGDRIQIMVRTDGKKVFTNGVTHVRHSNPRHKKGRDWVNLRR